MYQEALVRFRKGVLQQLKKAHDRAAHGGSTSRRRIANQVQKYKMQVNFQETVCEAVTHDVYCKMQCNLDGPYFDGLYQLSCLQSSQH